LSRPDDSNSQQHPRGNLQTCTVNFTHEAKEFRHNVSSLYNSAVRKFRCTTLLGGWERLRNKGGKEEKEEVVETFSSTLSRGTAAGHCLVE